MSTLRDKTTPLLDSINSPADLRKLEPEQLEQVCSEIRTFLISSLADNPGHFASSMGAVELTVALHYVFDTPRDRLVWDVGHQAYGHKLLTGRRDKFKENRKLGGLSGFPNPDESEYDTFAAGHASNSISAALGMAIASRIKGEERRNVVAIVGDASISGGLAFEGLNNAANTPNNLLIILNDNDMSIDANVGALNSYLAHLTASKTYNNLRFKLFNFCKKLHLISGRGRGAMLRFNNSLKSLLNHSQNIFEGLNIRYFGPFDGHDIETLVKVMKDIRDMEGPRILHLRTVKGKGYAPAEANPAVWHAPGKFDPQTGERKTSSSNGKPIKYQDVFGQTLLELARKDPKIVGVTAAMPSGTGMSIMQAEIPERVFDVGISEGHAVTFAGGMAKDGLKPFVAIYSSFLQRAYDHIIHDVALNRLGVTFCIDRAGLVGEDGATHHGAFDLAYLSSVPGMIIAAPRNEHMLRNLMFTAATTEHGPFAIRYPRGSGKLVDWKNEMKTVEIGRAQELRSGKDVFILTAGVMADNALAAVEGSGVDASVWDMVFTKPLDTSVLEKAAAAGVPVITVEDGVTHGGLGGAVAEWAAKNAPGMKVVSLGLPDKFVSQGTPDELYRMCGLDVDSIRSTLIKETAGK